MTFGTHVKIVVCQVFVFPPSVNRFFVLLKFAFLSVFTYYIRELRLRRFVLRLKRAVS